ncbi:MAG: 7,8-dihydro-8-oxoguanine triphosphatase [Waddliaceae bacterium]|nr:7,8-dihydro-8-oxoguanine triphosphatase [Waddliaceae bacterium]
MPYTPILGTLAYILSPDRQSVLMVHRTAREDDDHLGKYNGLGGKMEPNEDIMHCIKRELHEEAGIECESITLRGTVNWTGFGKNGEDWLGFIFLVEKFSGTPYSENPEGTLSWIPLSELNSLPMWEGDRFFLPLIFDENPKIFHGYMPYENHEPQSWSYTRL